MKINITISIIFIVDTIILNRLIVPTADIYVMAVKVNPEKLKSTIASLKARFETGTINNMRELTDLYVTGLITAIGIGYDGFINKCNHPEKFVMEDIIKLAQILDIDISLILSVVLKQAEKNVKPRDISHLLKSIS